MRVARTLRMAVLVFLTLPVGVATLSACGSGEDDDVTEVDRGRVELIVDEVSRTVWPGNVLPDGQRYVRLLNGYFEDEPTAYWFAGFASRNTADLFWFCPEDEVDCPFTKVGSLDPERVVGRPVFARIPGMPGFSPFWLTWRVRVPAGYQPDTIKSVDGIVRAVEEGRVQVEQVRHDFGGDIGPDETIMHCLMVLKGTELERNGEDLIGFPGTPSLPIPKMTGWFDGYEVDFFEFTPSEGVFSPDPASESRPMMRSAHIFVFHRDCKGGSESLLCERTAWDLAAVSERGVELAWMVLPRH